MNKCVFYLVNINGRVKIVVNIVEYVNFIYCIFIGKCIDRDFVYWDVIGKIEKWMVFIGVVVIL